MHFYGCLGLQDACCWAVKYEYVQHKHQGQLNSHAGIRSCHHEHTSAHEARYSRCASLLQSRDTRFYVLMSVHMLCRHAFGDQYCATYLHVKEPGKLEVVSTPSGRGEKQTLEVHQFNGAGVAMGTYNVELSITGLAFASFQIALVFCLGKVVGSCCYCAA